MNRKRLWQRIALALVAAVAVAIIFSWFLSQGTKLVLPEPKQEAVVPEDPPVAPGAPDAPARPPPPARI
jgi:hypothetical protein